MPTSFVVEQTIDEVRRSPDLDENAHRFIDGIARRAQHEPGVDFMPTEWRRWQGIINGLLIQLCADQVLAKDTRQVGAWLMNEWYVYGTAGAIARETGIAHPRVHEGAGGAGLAEAAGHPCPTADS